MEIQTEISQETVNKDFSPIGLDQPYWIIVQNNPVNFVDPWGLESYADDGEWAGPTTITSMSFGKWGLPIEVQYTSDPHGELAATYGPFLIVYGPTSRQYHSYVQDAIRYHEYIHVGQIGWGLRNSLLDEIEAYKKTIAFLENKLSSMCPGDDGYDELSEFKSDMEWLLQNQNYIPR